LVPVISFVGHHNSGKTTLLVKVIHNLTLWNIRTAVIKHSQHGFHVPEEKDSERLFHAGAGLVYASSPNMSLLYRREDNERDLKDIYDEVKAYADLVITEGYKTGPYPKIEVVRQATGGIIADLPNLIARVSDCQIDDQFPCFGFDEDVAIARFVAQRLGLL